MRFWDASGVVPLVLAEPSSDEMRKLLRSDPALTVWWGTRVECLSAIRRREREGGLAATPLQEALERLRGLGAAWAEILPGDFLGAEAERAVAVHPLRAGDAFQLAASLTWRPDPAARGEFVSRDQRLRDAAAREGFKVLPADLAA